MANIKENKKYHFTYKTTNLINNRYYLGMHSTNRIDDGYLGSGKRLYYELNKYGRNNFKFEILEQFNSREELVQAEINLITEQDIANPNCLNLKSGGTGGKCMKENHYQRLGSKSGNLHKERLEEDLEYRKDFSEKMSKSTRKRVLEVGKEEFYKKLNNGHSWLGKKHTPETLEKMKQSHKSIHVGEKNSQYGKPRSEETKQKIRESIKKTLEDKKQKAQNGK